MFSLEVLCSHPFAMRPRMDGEPGRSDLDWGRKVRAVEVMWAASGFFAALRMTAQKVLDL